MKIQKKRYDNNFIARVRYEIAFVSLGSSRIKRVFYTCIESIFISLLIPKTADKRFSPRPTGRRGEIVFRFQNREYPPRSNTVRVDRQDFVAPGFSGGST